MNLYERLRPGRPKVEEYDEILKLRLDGFTYDAISYFLGVSRQTIATICQINKLGGKIKERDINEINKGRIG